MLATRESWVLAGLFIVALAVRMIEPRQPIVENYVGRQVPTAMVARNLERGSGFFRPELDTAPFPNLFLVEPPLFAATVVCLRGVTGLPLELSGRLVSALAIVLGAWGLYGLARRRGESRAALLAVAAFVFLPVTIRYGRAFQPDALMLGLLVAGLRCWDEAEQGGGRRWMVAGALLLAAAMGLKVVAAYILVPLVFAILQPPRRGKLWLAFALVVPALLWYGHAALLLNAGAGSRASRDNGAIWLRVIASDALWRRATIIHAARFVVRSFTLPGLVLAILGLSMRREGNRLWRTWIGAALAMLAVLAGKLHHEYYWLAAAPVVAVGIGRAVDWLAERRPRVALATGAGLMCLAIGQTFSTWRTPAEWTTLPEAVRAIRAFVPRGQLVVAPEVLLFEADRRGCRLEYTRPAAARAAGEWGGTLDQSDPINLVEFYRERGARFVADLSPTDPARLALHEAIRRRYNVLVDRPGVLLAALTSPQDGPDGTR